MALLGNLTGSSQYFNDYRVYNGVATQSLRFDDGSSAFLSRTPDSAGNRKTWTWSGWLKRGILGGSHGLIESTSISFGLHDDTLFITVAGVGNGVSTAVFRDSSAWYHVLIAFDTTQASSADRVKFYVNGTQHSLNSTQVSQNTDYNINNTTLQRIGVTGISGSTTYIDGYLSEVNFIDGTALTPTSFGETKNGIWIPKKYTGSYGTNGFRLQFNQTGVGTASASTIGADTSGNTHHWTSSGIVASDCNMPDSPENNFCTMNPLWYPAGTLSEGNLKFIPTVSSDTNTVSTFIPTEKSYWEVYIVSGIAGNTYVGLLQASAISNNYNTSSADWVISYGSGLYRKYGTATTGQTTWGANDILGLAYDTENTTLYVYKNNVLISTITGLNDVEHYALFAGNSTSEAMVANFGQDSSFAGNATAQGNTDGNGIGDFYYAPPSGYLALCTSNLPEPTIGPNSATQADDYFNTVIYTGNGGTLAVDGFGHQPDLLWIKSRNITGNHRWTDSSRGVTNNIISNADDAEKGSSDAEDIDSFDTDGFTVTQASYDDYNDASDTYVAWSWKANGGTTVSVSESGNNPANVRQTNVTAGFSIITYTGTGAAGTIAHGLGVAPKAIITKKRNASGNWASYFGTADVTDPQTDALYLDLTDARTDSADFWNDTAPTASVYSIQDAGDTNTNDHTYVAYVFAEVEGYSKIGSYTGNGSTDGAFVFTGFKPAWVMVKRTDSANNWVINDSTRTPSNEITGSSSTLYADVDGHEGNYDTNVDFLSNGFKARTTGGHRNASGGTYIYMAFAEAPFKYANAR